MIKALLKENLVFLIVSFLAFSSTHALVQAQASDYTPVPFTETLTLSRGSVSPPSPNSFYLGRDDYCEITQSEWGWQSCASIDAFLLGGAPGVDTAIIEKPVSDGYVTYDDWNDADRDEEIAAIETELALSMRSQSEATGQDIHFLGWRAYPTLDQQKNYLYYATDIEWDCERLINITATIFDRRGYVTFSIVPLSSELNEAQIAKMVDDTLAPYSPAPDESYAAFETGDKIAAAGAVGVLATLVGVKYGKTAFAGLAAIALLVLKKAWFLLLFPLIWIKSFFQRKE